MLCDTVSYETPGPTKAEDCLQGTFVLLKVLASRCARPVKSGEQSVNIDVRMSKGQNV